MAVVTTPFVPAAFQVPLALTGAEFSLQMLSIDHIDKDFDAVTSSAEHVKTVWPGGTWPDGLTLRQNLIDLGWHEKEFQTRQSFAYTVLSPDGVRVLGCVYIYPSVKEGHDAEVYLWARQSELASGLEDRLYASVRSWIGSTWPFQLPAFPGRDVAWEDWHAKVSKLR
jgi:hypothetical protein